MSNLIHKATQRQQEIFNIVIQGFKKQDWMPSYADGRCFYREPSGLQCAAGMLIPDEIYDAKMEQNCITGLATKLRERNWKYLPEMSFIQDLQSIHDYAAIDSMNQRDSAKKDILKKSFKDFAAKRQLTFTEDPL
ncbi:MAG: hypothetical protein BWY21_00997 [Parcubacteria group bacterium ADurb.Bin216]|nr:MAG: hypothetical protein BWY21_00997 [Parcubacteria group bacterium ADurb.Bin216]